MIFSLPIRQEQALPLHLLNLDGPKGGGKSLKNRETFMVIVKATALKEHKTRRGRTGRHSRSRLGPYSDDLGLGGRRTDAGELPFLGRVPLSEKLFKYPSLSAKTQRSKRVGLLESKKLRYKHVTDKTIYCKNVT